MVTQQQRQKLLDLEASIYGQTQSRVIKFGSQSPRCSCRSQNAYRVQITSRQFLPPATCTCPSPRTRCHSLHPDHETFLHGERFRSALRVLFHICAITAHFDSTVHALDLTCLHMTALHQSELTNLRGESSFLPLVASSGWQPDHHLQTGTERPP